jgi:glutathione S-transferase
MKLMYSPTSPFVRRVRAAAIELDLAGQLQLEPIQVAPGRSNEAYAQQVNPLRKIPALVLDDGVTVLIDSAVICQFLDDLAGGGQLIPAAAPQKCRILSQQAIAHGMAEAMVLVRYETALRPGPLQWPDWIADQQDRFWSGLAWFEQRTVQTLSASGPRPDLSQLALACTLGYVDFRFPELNWPARAPHVSSWYQKIVARPSLATTDPRVSA